MWLLDTLESIDRFPPEKFTVYLKGGTCVQHYLPSERQRFSMDLDFSVCFQDDIGATQKSLVVKEYLGKLNEELLRAGWTTDHGTIRIPETSPGFNFICFSGRVFQPVKCRKTASIILGIKDAAYVKTEFFLHDSDHDFNRVKLSLISANYAEKEVHFNLASITRLLADKIIALSGEGYGARDESKDIIDLNSLSELNGINVKSAWKMISNWAKSHLDKDGNLQPIDPSVKIVHAAHRTAVTKSEITDEALAQMAGLLYARGRSGFNLSKDDWKGMCLQTVDFLDKQILPQFA